jgi:Glycosyl hydrolases family 16
MKYALALVVLALVICCVSAAGATASATAPPVTVKQLIFGDEFNGPAGARPSHRLWGAKGFGKWSGWSHIKENGAGSVVLTAYKNSVGWHTPWLSGKIGYQGPRYVEARAEVPCGAGTWSAPIWEWAYPYGRVPGFENDVAEQLGNEPTQYHATLHHWTNSGRDVQSSREFTARSPLCGTFHTYGAAIFSNRVDFYLDGAFTTSIPASAVGLWGLTTRKEVMNIDLAMGGLGGTIAVRSSIFLAVDFIHVYAI